MSVGYESPCSMKNPSNTLLAAALTLSVLFTACSAADGARINLTGRDLCWPSNEPRMAASMYGRLDLGVYPWYLDTPEGEVFQIDFAGLSLNTTGDAIVDASGNNLGNDGEMVTVFAGYGSDEILLVCAIEERHTG